MTPATARSFVTVTERPGQAASGIQLEMLAARYAWAASRAIAKDVLEAGCGAGLGLPIIAQVARSVHAGDVDADNLQDAVVACAEESNVELRRFPAEHLPYPDESFDLVLLFEAIYYVSDAPRFFQEAHRVLRPGGSLLIVTVNPAWTGFNPSPFSVDYFSFHQLMAGLAQAGFTVGVKGAFPENYRLDRHRDSLEQACGGRAKACSSHHARQGASQTDLLRTIEPIAGTARGDFRRGSGSRRAER